MARESGCFFSLDGPLDVVPIQGQMRAANLGGFHALVRHYGGDPARILDRHGIDSSVLGDTDHPVECMGAVKALEYCSTRFNDSLFGLRLADLEDLDLFGSVTAMARAAPSAREGLQCFISYLPVMHSPEGELMLVPTPDATELQWFTHTDFELSEQANYQALLLNLKIMRMLGGREFRPDYVDLAFPVRRKDVDSIEDKAGCRVRGRAGKNAIGFRSGILDRPLPNANKLIFNLLGGYFARVKATAGASIAERVEAYIRGALPSGSCTIARCARKLGTSVRTLQLHLTDRGERFSDMVEKYRVELAEKYLRDGSRTLDEIAALLGYSEQASFGRAFKRWTGVTPQSFRAGSHAAPLPGAAANRARPILTA
jgi:AraC-like DNA-binding protein